MSNRYITSTQAMKNLLEKLASDDQYRLAFATHPSQNLAACGLDQMPMPFAVNLPSKNAIQTLLDRYYCDSDRGCEEQEDGGGLFNLFIFRVSAGRNTLAKAK